MGWPSTRVCVLLVTRFQFILAPGAPPFTAAGASRPCASTRIKPEIDGLRLVGGNADSLTCPGTPTTTHAFTTDSKLMYTLGGIAPIHLKPELTIAGSRRSGSAGGGRVVINLT